MEIAFDLILPDITKLSNDLACPSWPEHQYQYTKTRLELNPEKDSYLTIDKGSEPINSIVYSSAKGEGEISVRVEGINRTLHITQSFNYCAVEENYVMSNDWEAMDKSFQNILI